MSQDNDNQFFDNTDDELEQLDEGLDDADELPADDNDDDGEEPARRGNPAIALRQEREEKRQLKQQLEELKQEQNNLKALYEQMGHRGYVQQQQPDPSQLEMQRQQFLDQFNERPDEVFNNLTQQMQRQMYATQAPLMVDRVFSEAVKGDDELATF
jgi:hypothetical protein